MKTLMDSGLEYFETLAQTGRIVLRLVSIVQEKLFLEDLTYHENDFKDLTKVYPIFAESRAKRLKLGASALEQKRELLSFIRSGMSIEY